LERDERLPVDAESMLPLSTITVERIHFRWAADAVAFETVPPSSLDFLVCPYRVVPHWIISFDDTLQTENVSSGFQVWISISPCPELH
jgi:hypothetical protein